MSFKPLVIEDYTTNFKNVKAFRCSRLSLYDRGVDGEYCIKSILYDYGAENVKFDACEGPYFLEEGVSGTTVKYFIKIEIGSKTLVANMGDYIVLSRQHPNICVVSEETFKNMFKKEEKAMSNGCVPVSFNSNLCISEAKNISLYDEYLKFEGLKSLFRSTDDFAKYDLCVKVTRLIADYLNNSLDEKWESEGLFDEIDKVLSIKLTDKQKDYLKNKPVIFQRQEGYTTVHIIKQLLSGRDITNKSIIYENCTTLHHRKLYLDMFVCIFEKFYHSDLLKRHIGSIELSFGASTPVDVI